MNIRRYSPKDFATVVLLMEDFQDYLISLDPLQRLARFPEYGKVYTKNSLAVVRKGQGLFLLAENNGVIVGFVCGIIEKQTAVEKLECIPTKAGRILELYVTQTLRSQGVGQQLMAAMEEFFVLQECTVIRLEVFSPNINARAFYAKQGFKDRNITLMKEL